jgi:ABC-type uncharacterized transport system auxiliary subunit
MNATITTVTVVVVVIDDENNSHIENRIFHTVEDAIEFVDNSSTPAWVEAVDLA